MKKASKFFVVVATFLMPYFAMAQNYIGSQTTGTAWGSIKDLVEAVGKFINNTVMPILVVMAVGYFFWNIIQYIRNMSNEKERENFRKYSINGLLGLFVMLSLWGIIAIGTQTVFQSQPVIPQFKTNPNGGVTPP